MVWRAGLGILIVVVGCGDAGSQDASAASGDEASGEASAASVTPTSGGAAETGAAPTSVGDPDTGGPTSAADPDTGSQDTGGPDTGETGEETGDTGDAEVSGCEGRLSPVAPAGAMAVVGDGSAASCTEDALHAAVDGLNAGDGGTLTFACGGPHTITLTKSMFVAKPTIVDGGGEITLSGGGAVRVIELDHYVDFVIQRITVRDGFVAAGSADESGAGLLHPWFGTLKVIDATFADNTSESLAADVGGGAIYAGGLTEAVISGSTFTGNRGSIGGGILSRSTNLRVVDSRFTDNTATSYAEDGQFGNGGGLYIDRMFLDAPVDFVICGGVFLRNHATQHGSAFFSYNLEGGGARFDRCTFADNDMAGSPGGGTGTVYHQGVPLTLVASTFSDNVTGAHAGGLFLGGGTAAEVTNCTFTGNRTPGNAGALWAGSGVVSVTSTTFAGNDADYGPVIFKGGDGAVTLTGVVFAGNTTANEFSALACHETFTDGGGNVQWPDVKNNGNADTPCAAGVVFADPQLTPLADNGGPTPTMALPAGSPAIDAGQGCPPTDQRGVPRAGACDAGAYEYQP